MTYFIGTNEEWVIYLHSLISMSTAFPWYLNLVWCPISVQHFPLPFKLNMCYFSFEMDVVMFLYKCEKG